MIIDKIDIGLWQNVLDKFASVIQLPVLTLDLKGNEITKSNKHPLYCKIVQESNSELCRQCWVNHMELLKKGNKEILFYTCKCGLLNIMAPIIVDNELIGAVICESIKQKEDYARACQRVGKMIKIKPIELIDAINCMKITEREMVLQYGTLLHILSQSIPTIAREKKHDSQKITMLQEIASTDKLTGLSTRAEFMNQLEQETAKIAKSPLSVVMIDIDDFKQYNDSFGHQEGDILLKSASDIIKHAVRENDTAGRYGGEEFILILPDATEENSAAVCERIRSTLEQKEFKRKTTASFGICTAYTHADKEKLIEEADKALYQAKSSGKNRLISVVLK
jgi:diguanylate cyclase (GGDEF)-like protein